MQREKWNYRWHTLWAAQSDVDAGRAMLDAVHSFERGVARILLRIPILRTPTGGTKGSIMGKTTKRAESSVIRTYPLVQVEGVRASSAVAPNADVRHSLMKVLNRQINPAAFLDKIRVARARVLMLDYDGTLAPFHVRTELAFPYPGVTGVLDELMRDRRTRVIIVSGRRAVDVIPLLSLRTQPEIWGSHGWERLLANGKVQTQNLPPDVRRALEEADKSSRELIRSAGRLERKPASVALHWRGLSALAVAKIQERALAAWQPLTRAHQVELLSFDGGVELRVVGCNKRHAVMTVLSETAVDSAIAYLGDDMTDEDAFEAVKARGLAVLVRPQLRETRADIWLRPPREVIAFLKDWCRRARGASGSDVKCVDIRSKQY